MEHSFVFLLLELSLILTAAKIGGLAARSLRLPVALGELFAGVILGNMTYFGFRFFAEIRSDLTLSSLAELGAIILMFEVGVESTVGKLFEVGWNALMVAIAGVIAPFLLGFGVVRLFYPGLTLWVYVFLGAALCATSVGISTRVLKDLGQPGDLRFCGSFGNLGALPFRCLLGEPRRMDRFSFSIFYLSPRLLLTRSPFATPRPSEHR